MSAGKDHKTDDPGKARMAPEQARLALERKLLYAEPPSAQAEEELAALDNDFDAKGAAISAAKVEVKRQKEMDLLEIGRIRKFLTDGVNTGREYRFYRFYDMRIALRAFESLVKKGFWVAYIVRYCEMHVDFRFGVAGSESKANELLRCSNDHDVRSFYKAGQLVL